MKRLAAILILLTATACRPISAQVSDVAAYPDSLQVRYLTTIQQQIFSDDFDGAERTADSLSAARPGDPAGCLFKAIAVVSRMFDAEDDTTRTEFKVLLDSVNALADERLTNADRRERAWMHLYRGHAASYDALYESHFGSLISALRKARAGAAEYRQGLDEDSTVYDLYFGLGLYHYWKSAKAGVLRWVGLVHNERDRGIRELQLAADSSLISRQAARSALIWIWMDREQYDSALALTSEMLRRYPDGRSFLWPLAQTQFARDNWNAAASTYRRLRDRIALHPGNYYNLIECDYYLARSYEQLRLDDSCRAVAQRTMAYYKYVPGDVRREQRDLLNFLERTAD